jgi:hypothetical protein
MESRDINGKVFKILNSDGSVVITVDIKHVEVEELSVSDSDRHDLDYSGLDYDVFNVECLP